YEVKGEGHPLLLLHAGVADSRMWDAQFDAFSQHYRVIRFDLRGFGRSDMPSGSFSNYEDVRALLDYLQIESTYLIGISFGGLIALDFTLAYPDYVKALVLGATSVSGDTPSERIRQFWEAEDAAFESGDLDGATELNLRLWVDGPHRQPDEVDSAVREQVRQMQLNIFQKEVPDDVEERRLDPPAIQRLHELKIPVLLMVGDLDLEEKVALAERLEREIDSSEKVIIPGVAHMLNMEKPALFNEAVLDFLAVN
ncbi:MAG: alpha/beta hydrolase, partial [Candidatus Promineifilaceae bacterium]